MFITSSSSPITGLCYQKDRVHNKMVCSEVVSSSSAYICNKALKSDSRAVLEELFHNWHVTLCQLLHYPAINTHSMGLHENKVA